MSGVKCDKSVSKNERKGVQPIMPHGSETVALRKKTGFVSSGTWTPPGRPSVTDSVLPADDVVLLVSMGLTVMVYSRV